MHMVLHLHLLRELNSQCLSLARVRKASRPSIRSQESIGSGSTMGGRVLAMGTEWRWITKNTFSGQRKTHKNECHQSSSNTQMFIIKCLFISKTAFNIYYKWYKDKTRLDLFVLLHGGVKLLGQVIGYIRHPWLLLIGSAHAAFVFIGLLIVLLLCVFAVTRCSLWEINNVRYSRKQFIQWGYIFTILIID